MRGTLTILKNEFLAYFRSSIAYIFAVVFLLVVNGLFMNTFFLIRTCDMRSFFEPFPVILLVFTSALTMRLWAEERKSGTLGLLYSFPFSGASLVLGKFLATFLFGTLVLSGTLVIPFMLAVLGDPDQGHLLGGYIGSLFLLAYFVALGLALSGLFEDQITAFILTLVVGLVSILVGTDLVSSTLDSWLPGVGSFLRETFGLLPHFQSFVKGILPLRDILFFTAFIVAFLLINFYTVQGYLRYYFRKFFYPASALVIGAVLLLNGLLSQVRLPRIDLTEGKLYTISPAAKNILERLKAPVKVTYYVSASEKLPTPMKTLARDVRDLLEEFAALSPNFSYAVVDPEKDPELLEDLRDKGVEPFAAQTIERDQLSIRKVYSSLVISYLDKPEEVIPQILPESLSSLEYDLISRIYKLTLEEKPLVAFYTGGEPLAGEEFHVVREILRTLGLKIKNIKLTEDSLIPDNTKVLVLLSPGKLNDRQLYEISAYLHRGGTVLVAAQANRFSYFPNAENEIVATPIPQSLKINKLLSAYGVSIPKDLLFDLQSIPMAVSQERSIGIFRTLVRIPVNFPMQIQLLPDQMERNLAFTQGVSALLYLWGSPVDIDEKRLEELKLKEEFFLRTSAHAWRKAFDAKAFTEKEVVPPHGGFESYPLAVFLEGIFPELFDGTPPPWPKKKDEDIGEGSDNGTRNTETKPEKKAEKKVAAKKEATGRLVIIGCSEMFTDRIIGLFDNTLFWVNTVESLALGGDLVRFRAKLKPVRYIGEVSEREKLAWRLVVVLLPASLWVLFGLSVFYYRRRRRRLYYEKHQERREVA